MITKVVEEYNKNHVMTDHVTTYQISQPTTQPRKACMTYYEGGGDESDKIITTVQQESPFARIRKLDEQSELIGPNFSDSPSEYTVAIDGLSEFQSVVEKKPSKKKRLDDDETTLDSSSGGRTALYKTKKYKEGHYINCDLRYFNLNMLGGGYDVVMLDPPWRMSQRQGEESNMFSNTQFKLNYNTLSNEEIIDLNVECLSESGFCFLWVTNAQLQFGLTCLNKWGYTYVDKIVWIKRSKASNTTIYVSTGYYFLHSTEICLVGVKHSTKNQRLEYISKVANDVLFGRVGIQSQKPEEIYEVIDYMTPGAKKIELFSKNHNVRKGWLSLGNRLGPNFEAKSWNYGCTECKDQILTGMPRFKHKYDYGKDLCKACFDTVKDPKNFFGIENDLEEPVYHDWFTCDRCQQYPISGVRFSCVTCQDFDLCEGCFDFIIKEKLHDSTHVFHAIEVPEQGNGFAVHHQIRCQSCLTCPIIGERFHCLECQDMNFCRNCFFKQKEIKTHVKEHLKDHEMEMILEPVSKKSFACGNCKTIPNGPVFQCKTCANLFLCTSCFQIHDQIQPFDWYPSHKQFHEFAKIK
jgi:N6-adenosine-specific RNA methylase IME4